MSALPECNVRVSSKDCYMLASLGGCQLTKKRILITGAAGNIGSKLRKAFGNRYDLVLIDKRTNGDDTIVCADLSRYENRWASRFTDVSAVIHLAGNPDEKAAWDELFADNIDAVLNVCHACVGNKVERLIFASSCHTMGGYFDSKVSRITGDMKPLPAG
jgi:uronate dehydrogenase